MPKSKANNASQKNAFGSISFIFKGKIVVRETIFTDENNQPFVFCGHPKCPEAAYTTTKLVGDNWETFAVKFLEEHWTRFPDHFSETYEQNDTWKKVAFNVHSSKANARLLKIRRLEWGPQIGFPVGSDGLIQHIFLGKVDHDIHKFSMIGGPSIECHKCKYRTPSCITYDFSNYREYTTSNFNQGIYHLIEHWGKESNHFITNPGWEVVPFDRVQWNSLDLSILTPWIFNIACPLNPEPLRSPAIVSNIEGCLANLPWLNIQSADSVYWRWQEKVDIQVQTIEEQWTLTLAANAWGLITCPHESCGLRFAVCGWHPI